MFIGLFLLTISYVLFRPTLFSWFKNKNISNQNTSEQQEQISNTDQSNQTNDLKNGSISNVNSTENEVVAVSNEKTTTTEGQATEATTKISGQVAGTETDNKDLGQQYDDLNKKIYNQKTDHSKGSGPLIGQLIAGISLVFGMFFFAYSLKYYFIILIVIISSIKLNGKNGKNGNNHSNNNGNHKNNGQNNGNGWLNKLFNHNGSNGQTSVGMQNDLRETRFENQPFISIQLPFYNEKKVANRILTACTSFDYKNYEVIVIDDSTDETIKILEKWKKHPRVKVIHRADRSGFKGGALQVALGQTDPRTEFIVIFDADFIPYPDTLKQFLKYFWINGFDNNGNGNHLNNNNHQGFRHLLNGSNNHGNGNGNNHNGNGNGYKYSRHGYLKSNVAAVQGYQWHVLNKNENWITRGIRSEFAGSYVVERPATEILGELKQIAGSVYMIRADVLRKYGWSTSITEDFELTMRLYRDGYKVIYTPYIQGPAECVSTLKRLIRQRSRWAEGHTNNVRKYFWSMLKSKKMTRKEKLEFLYLAPYYLQSAFFIIGTLCWFISDALLHSSLPYWTALWGWALVFTNFFALPLMNALGLFLEESKEKDYLGLLSFIALSYIVAPFQAYAAVKGLFIGEGPWFRTPKSGIITDSFIRSRYRRWFAKLLPGRGKGKKKQKILPSYYLKLVTSANRFNKFRIKASVSRKLTASVAAGLILFTLLLNIFSNILVPSQQSGISFKQITPENKSKESLVVNQAKQEKELNDFIFNTKGISNLPIAAAKPEQGDSITPEKQKTEPGSTPASELAKKEQPLPTPSPTPAKPGQTASATPNQPPVEKGKPLNELMKPPSVPQIPEGQDRVELTEKRTTNSKTYYNKDGNYTLELAADPIHYQDENGIWQDIDTTIKPINNSNEVGWLERFGLVRQVSAQGEKYDFGNLTNNFRTYYKNNPHNADYLKFEANGKSISFALNLEVGAQQPVVDKNQITYLEVMPGIDLRYTVTLTGLLEEYIVKTPEALAQLDKLYQTFNLEGVNFEQQPDGSIQFFDSQNQNKTWHIPAPLMYELDNQDESSSGLHYELASQNGENKIKKVIDQTGQDWLNNPDRKYPIAVDLTTLLDYTTIATADDGYVEFTEGEDVPYVRNTTDNTAHSGYYITSFNDRSFIEFATTSVPEITVQKVALQLEVTSIYGAGDTVAIRKLDQTIGDYPDDDTGNQALYDDIGDVTNTIYVAASTSFTSTGIKNIDLGSTAVSDMQTLVNASPNNPFVIGLQGSDETTHFTAFYTREKGNVTDAPKLVVQYSEIAEGWTGFNFERNLFYDTTNSVHWAFIGDGSSSIYSYYSTDDGATWTKSGSAISSSITWGSSLWWDQTTNKVYFAYYTGSWDIALKVGTVGANSISWGSAKTVFDGSGASNYYVYPVIARDSAGYCWIGARYFDTAYSFYTTRSDTTSCDAAGDDYSNNTTYEVSSNSANSNVAGMILPQSSQDMYAIWYDGADGKMYGDLWDDSAGAWANADTNFATALSGSILYAPSAVVDANNWIHVIFITTDNDVWYDYYDGDWDKAEYEIFANTQTLYSPTLSLDTATGWIYAIFHQSNQYGNGNIYYKIGKSPWGDVTNDWTPSGTSGVTTFVTVFNPTYPISNYSANGRVFVMWREGNTATVQLEFDNILIPENIWWLLPIIGFVPIIIRNLKGRKKRKLLNSSSYFNSKKK